MSKPSRFIVLAFATGLAASCGTPTTEHVSKLDLLASVTPETPIMVRELRTEGALRLCRSDNGMELSVALGSGADGDGCTVLGLERVDHEGAFPYIDATVGRVAYPANEAHLMVRGGQWFLFLEGGHNQSVISQHAATVFQVSDDDALTLELACKDEIEAADEEPQYECVDNLNSLDADVIAWSGRSSCSIDYSMCSVDGGA